MEKSNISDLKEMKKNDTLGMAEDVRAWLAANPGKTQADFARMAGFSLRRLQDILSYDGTGDEPNWTREIRDGIMKVIECEAFHTPKHNIK